MRIALVACSNGLGHIKRIVGMVARLVSLVPDVEATLFCEERQSEVLGTWAPKADLVAAGALRIQPVSLPLKWFDSSDAYGPWLLDWDVTFGDAMRIDRFDHVVSDNFVEPLAYASRVTLMGSFLWSDVLLRAYPDNDDVRTYADRAEALVERHKPQMIVNRYFAMPSVLAATQPVEVGMTDWGQKRNGGFPADGGLRVLVGVGASPTADALLERIADALVAIDRHPAPTIACPERAVSIFASRGLTARPFDFNDGDFAECDVAIIRAGLGMISECVAARIPMVSVEETNPEIEFNHAQLLRYGIAVPLSAVDDSDVSPLRDPAIAERMKRRMDEFASTGLEEAAAFVADRIAIR